MKNCATTVNHSGFSFNFNSCTNVIAYEIQDETKFNQKSLMDLSEACYDAYKFRLSDISDIFSKIGRSEYKLINQELINLILPFNPLKFSFSITPDPSLHFFTRISATISLFVEIFLDLDDGHDTFIQVAKSNHNIYERNLSFDNAIEDVREILEKEFSNKPQKNQALTKDFDECRPYQIDFSLPKKR